MVAVGAADGGDAKPMLAQLAAFGLFAGMNISLNLFNTWALKKVDSPSWAHPGFDFPIFYTMFHQLVSSVAAFGLCACVIKPTLGLPSFQQYWEYKYAIVAISVCSALNAGLNNVSLSLVSLFINQTIKAMQPLPTTFFSWCVAGKQYSLALIVTVTAIVIANIMALWNKVHSGSSDSNSVVGIVACVISLLAASLRPVIMMVLMDGTGERPKLNPTVVLVYDAATAFVLMLLYWVCSPERQASIDYLSAHSQMGVMIIVVGSTLAFVFNLSVYYVRAPTARRHSTRPSPHDLPNLPVSDQARRHCPPPFPPTRRTTHGMRAYLVMAGPPGAAVCAHPFAR